MSMTIDQRKELVVLLKEFRDELDGYDGVETYRVLQIAKNSLKVVEEEGSKDDESNKIS